MRYPFAFTSRCWKNNPVRRGGGKKTSIKGQGNPQIDLWDYQIFSI